MDPITPDQIDLDHVQRVDDYRRWLRADRLYYEIARPQRKGSAPRMPILPTPTDYAHASAFAAL